MKHEYDVSILTPYHNEPLALLERNLSSVAHNIMNMNKRTGNTVYSVQQIVVVDFWDDNMARWVGPLNDKYEHVTLLAHSKNKGLPAARNTGLKLAKGEYIMLLDTDDCFTIDRISVQLDFMKKHDLDHCYGGYVELHGDKPPYPRGAEIIPPEFNRQYLLDLNNICYCGSNCFKREIVNHIGGFDEKLTGLGAEDLEFWIRLSGHTNKIKCMPRILYRLGITSRNMTAKYLKGGQFKKAYDYIKTKHNLK